MISAHQIGQIFANIGIWPYSFMHELGTHFDMFLYVSQGGVPDVHKMCPETLHNQAFYMGKSTPIMGPSLGHVYGSRNAALGYI